MELQEAKSFVEYVKYCKFPTPKSYHRLHAWWEYFEEWRKISFGEKLDHGTWYTGEEMREMTRVEHEFEDYLIKRLNRGRKKSNKIVGIYKVYLVCADGSIDVGGEGYWIPNSWPKDKYALAQQLAKVWGQEYPYETLQAFGHSAQILGVDNIVTGNKIFGIRKHED